MQQAPRLVRHRTGTAGRVQKQRLQYGLLPVTTSASERMRKDKRHKKLWPFLDQLASAEFYPVGKVSWAATNAALKETVGQAAMKGGDPKSVLTTLQRKAEAAEKKAESA
ncbi:hypothetical protein [Streptomyces albus]|uniref:hypothetical protein n=1 Tax=Streptomyces albus TaxID=1888 RepID=UPI001F089F33|nr:hypothetical protein [Streptomyces albus]